MIAGRRVGDKGRRRKKKDFTPVFAILYSDNDGPMSPALRRMSGWVHIDIYRYILYHPATSKSSCSHSVPILLYSYPTAFIANFFLR